MVKCRNKKIQVHSKIETCPPVSRPSTILALNNDQVEILYNKLCAQYPLALVITLTP